MWSLKKNELRQIVFRIKKKLFGRSLMTQKACEESKKIDFSFQRHMSS